MKKFRWLRSIAACSFMLLLVSAQVGNAAYRITWKVIDVDYLDRSIVVKDLFGLEGIHALQLPLGASMPFEGELCEGEADARYYYIKIRGEWYSWRR